MRAASVPMPHKKLFEKWLNVINPPNWKKLTFQKIRAKYFVCHSHFDTKYSLPGTKRGLTVDAVASIGIPGTNQLNIDIPCSMIVENSPMEVGKLPYIWESKSPQPDHCEGSRPDHGTLYIADYRRSTYYFRSYERLTL